MASINNIVSKVTSNTGETNLEGASAQVQSALDDSISSLNATANKTKQNVQTAAQTEINNLKSKVNDLQSDIKGMIPGTSNAYSSKTGLESQKAYNALDGNYNNLNFNDMILPYTNPLLSYHNYTWNFSLYTMSPSEYDLFLDDPDNTPINKYVVAESAVTGRYSIDSVKLKQAGPATPGQTSNYSMISSQIVIKENGGQHFFDDLIVLSNTLGYKKFMDVPFVLELNFIGFDGETGLPKTITNLNRKWGVRLNNVSATASQAGGGITYTINMTSTRGGMMDNKDWTLMETYTCTTGTFGEFIKQLQDHMNNVATDQYGYLRYRFPIFANNEYFKMEFPSELGNMPINYDVKQSPEVTQTPNGASASKAFTWGADVPISRVIDDVLDCCIPFNESTEKKRIFVNIIPVTRYVGFDPVRNTSAYQNYFYILKYKIGDVTSKDDLEHEVFNINYFYDNADKVLDVSDPSQLPKINAKRYDYQFSGLNNEILNLDIKFDQGFAIATTRNPSSKIDPQNSAGTHVAQTLELAGQQFSTSDTQQLWAKSQSLIREQQNGRELNDEERQFIRDAQGVAATQVMSTEGENDQTTTNLSIAPALPAYIEDFRNTINVGEEGANGLSGNAIVDSLPTENVAIGKTNSASKMDNSSTDELDRRLVRDNYYNRSFLGRLDMKVVGDPFWLGWGDYSFMRYLKVAVAGDPLVTTDDDRHFANFLTTETYLLLNLKPIIGISDDTGILEVQGQSVFNQTFYRVNTVTSEFGPGGFTQQISGGLVMRSLRRKDDYTQVTESTEDIKKNGKTQ